MSEKKNIDRLFQEKFKDFEAAPPEMVWDNIHEALQGKKKRRVIPLWFKLGGVAAVLLIGFLLLMPFGNADVNNGASPVVNSNKTTPKNGTNAIPGQKPTPPNRHIEQSGTPAPNVNDAVVVSNGNNQTENQPNNADAHNNTNSTVKTTGAAGNRNRQNRAQTGVAQTSSHNKNAVYGQKSGVAAQRSNNGVTNTDGGYADNSNTQKTVNKTAANGTNSAYSNNPDGSGQKVAQDNVAGGANQNGAAIAQQDNTGGDTPTGTNDNIINNEIDEALAVADTATVPAPVNELEQLLQEKLNGTKDKEEDAVAANAEKWNVRPQVAPLFYNSLSQGSPIDMQFAGNAKAYDNTLSYGLGVDYAVTDRLTIRSGINRVDLNYATQDVQFYASLNSSTSNIAAKTSSANIVVQSATANTANLPGIVTLASDQLPQEKFQGSMVQKMGYVEVPVEMSYALLTNKFGIDVIGGMSTLFLSDNNVSVINTEGLGTNVGQAQNLNNIHFSTNVGLGFKYKFFPALEARFEPMFKYQVNTFSNDSGNFKPYFIGLYSGVSFSF